MNVVINANLPLLNTKFAILMCYKMCYNSSCRPADHYYNNAISNQSLHANGFYEKS